MFFKDILSIVGQECMAPPHMSLLSEPHYRDRHPEGYHVGYVSFDVSKLGRKKGRYTFTSRANVDEVINCTSALITRSPIKSCIYKLYRGATSLRFSDTHSPYMFPSFLGTDLGTNLSPNLGIPQICPQIWGHIRPQIWGFPKFVPKF